MLYKNLNDTSDNRCNCASWLRHWEFFSRRKAERCSVTHCNRVDLVGAHVQKSFSTVDRSWFIVPLCIEHNNHNGHLHIDDTIPLVSANVQETCGA
jgi:hypothetical protein